MSQEVRKWFVNGLFHLLVNGVYWGYTCFLFFHFTPVSELIPGPKVGIKPRDPKKPCLTKKGFTESGGEKGGEEIAFGGDHQKRNVNIWGSCVYYLSCFFLLF